MGNALQARARIQINLAVSQVVDIKQVANFPDIVFPILWFEEVRYRLYLIWNIFICDNIYLLFFIYLFCFIKLLYICI